MQCHTDRGLGSRGFESQYKLRMYISVVETQDLVHGLWLVIYVILYQENMVSSHEFGINCLISDGAIHTIVNCSCCVFSNSLTRENQLKNKEEIHKSIFSSDANVSCMFVAFLFKTTCWVL